MELDPDIVKLFQNLLVKAAAPSIEELEKFTLDATTITTATVATNRPKQQQIEHHHHHRHHHHHHHSYTIIPKFFFNASTSSNDTLHQSLRKEAHSLYLQKRSLDLMDNEELNILWNVMEKYSKSTPHGQQLINYEDFEKIRETVEQNCRKFLTARIYAQLQCISGYPGQVEISTLFNYVMRRVFMLQCRIGLSFYDCAGQGYLRDIDLENYIIDMIPTLTQIKDAMEPSFQAYYVCTCTKKFCFFLDPMHTGRLRIRDILASGLITELLELRDEREMPTDSMNESTQQRTLNWFSMESVLTVYGSYLSLDKDQNGMLSKSELAGYGTGTLTTIFIDRIFDECRTFDGEMDYKTYLDFVLAMENRNEPQALSYFFRLLDVQHVGYLTQQTLHYFFRGIQEQILAHNVEAVNFEDLKDEIFDMVKPKQPHKITLQDLINCGQAETVISILIEFHKFWAYENCESSRI